MGQNWNSIGILYTSYKYPTNLTKTTVYTWDNGEVSAAPWKRGAAGSTPASQTNYPFYGEKNT